MREDHDYKIDYLIEEQRYQRESADGWIYIGVDKCRDQIAKIGLTGGLASTRDSSSQNPFYTLFCAFKVKAGIDPCVLRQIESAAKEFLKRRYVVLPHVGSARDSEWFRVSPEIMRSEVRDFLSANFMRHMYGYHCHDREIDVIYEWENTALLYGCAREPYVARDLSDPFPAPECMTPPGCGADCDCW